MGKKKEAQTVQVKLVLTEGYQQRFTEAALKVYKNRLKAIAEQKKQQEEAG